MPERPALPDIDADWDGREWAEAGQQFLQFATDVSTGWRERTPGAGHAPSDAFTESLGGGGPDVGALLARLRESLVPSAAYNGHPRFFGYITSSPAPIGVLGDLATSALNQNQALWRLAPAATAIELQTIAWIKDLLGYPREAEGLFVSGGQFANIVAHQVLRDAKAPWDLRTHGVGGQDGRAPQLRVYASSEVHHCHEQAAEMLGLGRGAIRLVPIDDAYRMRLDALASMIAEDRARGDLPIAIAATAGTVGTGAVDPLRRLVGVARDEDLWLHVDGAYGAFAALVPGAHEELAALGDADSLACDPHKWLYAPIDAGVTLIRKPGLLDRSFAFGAAYLQSERASGEIDMVERSPENTRRFRALKVWLQLQYYGRDGYRKMIERNLMLARYMEELVAATPGLALAAPRGLSIVCWRAEPPGVTDAARLDQLQRDVIAELERRGIAFVSNAALRDGGVAIRACIVNFRTTPADVEAMVAASAEIASELAAARSG